MNEDDVIIFDPLSDLKELAEEIKKQEEERGLEDGMQA